MESLDRVGESVSMFFNQSHSKIIILFNQQRLIEIETLFLKKEAESQAQTAGLQTYKNMHQITTKIRNKLKNYQI